MGWRVALLGLLAMPAFAACGGDARGSSDEDSSSAGRTPAIAGNGGNGATAGESSGATAGSEEIGGRGGIGGGDGAGGSEPTPRVVDSVEQVTGSTFVFAEDCTVTVERDDSRPPERQVPCDDWQFHFRANARGALELLSAAGVLELGRLEQEDARWRLASKLTFTTRYIWESLVGSVPELTFDPDGNPDTWDLPANEITFEFEDEDGNGRADSVRVEGVGVYENAQDDYSDYYVARFSMVGALDVTAPTIADRIGSPFSFSTFSASEVLDASSKATLTVDGVEIPLETQSLHGAITGYKPTRLLPPGARGELAIVGKDLAGLPIDASVSVEVSTLPAPAPADFETATAFAVLLEYPNSSDQGEVGVRASYAGVEAIEGEQSFLVPPGTRVLLHFERPEDTARMSFSMRQMYDAGMSEVIVQAMVAGGSQIHELELEVAPGDDWPTDESWPEDTFFEPLEQVEFELSDAGKDVILIVDAPYSEGAWSFSTGAWIDSVRFE